MSPCPVGKLGRHDMRAEGDVLRCRYCPATRAWPKRKRMSPISLAPRDRSQTWR